MKANTKLKFRSKEGSSEEKRINSSPIVIKKRFFLGDPHFFSFREARYFVFFLLALSLFSCRPKTYVAFGNIKDGDTLRSPFNVQMLSYGMRVSPAGKYLEGEGHHHILINSSSIPKGTTIPQDEQHLHFGTGAKETELNLEPGNWTLTLQFADGLHRSYGVSMSKTIEIEVLP